jgi:hypothetical protein
MSLCLSHAIFTPGTTQTVYRLRLNLFRAKTLPYFDTISFFRCFNDDSLALVSSNTYLTQSSHAFSMTFTTTTLYCSRSWWFATQPAPWLRGVCPHLAHSYAFQLACFITCVTSMLSRHTIFRKSVY